MNLYQKLSHESAIFNVLAEGLERRIRDGEDAVLFIETLKNLNQEISDLLKQIKDEEK